MKQIRIDLMPIETDLRKLHDDLETSLMMRMHEWSMSKDPTEAAIGRACKALFMHFGDYMIEEVKHNRRELKSSLLGLCYATAWGISVSCDYISKPGRSHLLISEALTNIIIQMETFYENEAESGQYPVRIAKLVWMALGEYLSSSEKATSTDAEVEGIDPGGSGVGSSASGRQETQTEGE